MRRQVVVPVLALLLSACSNAPIQPPGDSHLRAEKVSAGETATIPAPVQHIRTLPPPKAAAKVETYSVVVHNVKIDDLLFALARDAQLNVDIHPNIKKNETTVSLNAIDQTLPQLLERITRMTDLRWELIGQNLLVMPDEPHLRTYRVDYVNMARQMTGKVSIETEIPTTGGSGVGSGGGNLANTTINTFAVNSMMTSLVENIRDILRETDKYIPKNAQTASLISNAVTSFEGSANAQGSGAASLSGPANTAGSQKAVGNNLIQQSGGGTQGFAGTGNQHIAGAGSAAHDKAAEANQVSLEFREAAAVIANFETGVLTVRATKRQHDKIQEFLDHIMLAAKRQVLIEATIVEVRLSDGYQQGIEWNRLSLSGLGLRLAQRATGNLVGPNASLMEIGYTNPNSPLGNLAGTARLLESFGTVKVLSSPKISVLNNQTAMLKVVDNHVYFKLDALVTPGMNGAAPIVSYTTTPKTVSVGFVMTVTPQIADTGIVTLNLRPTISRITNWKPDPNPELKRVDAINLVPEIQTREMESIIRVRSGNIAVLGGLMEDSVQNNDHTVPGISRIPVLGNLFQNRDDLRRKTELVIFLRPVIIKDASIEGDFADYREQMPDRAFFDKNPLGPQRQVFDLERGRR